MFIISIIGSFLGGVAALFAPCCVTILFPLYLGTIFKQTGRVLAMTAVFALGLAAVLMPITLGAGFLAEFLHVYHKQFYIFGGIMLVLAGLGVVFGIKMPMPKLKQPVLPSGDSVLKFWPAFGLGIFSGIASACCAPVLAGSVALAVLSGSFVRAVVVSGFYIIGMVAPLFILAFFWKKLKISDLKIFRGNALKISAGALFLAIGAMMFYLGATGNEFWSPVWQINIAGRLKDFSSLVVDWLRSFFR
jgi:cytochrome c biogenesis protein CcdA